MFGKKIELNYSGEQSFKTRYGAITTIIAVLFMLGFTTIKIKKLVLRENPTQI